mgnify:CR=1 FL=1
MNSLSQCVECFLSPMIIIAPTQPWSWSPCGLQVALLSQKLNRAALRCHFPSFGIQFCLSDSPPPPPPVSRFPFHHVFDGCAISQFQVQHRPKELPFLIINENCISSLLTRARDGIRPVDFLHHRWLVWVSILFC